MESYMKEAFSLEKIEAELLNEDSFFYLVEKDAEVVGYFKLNIAAAQTEAIEDGLEVERIYILTAFQGLRIGQKMMDKVFEIAKSMGKSRLWLGVWTKNDGAIRFYERNGFRKFGEHFFSLGDELQSDFLMEAKI
jgi:ribosomal protein S18 acetylase RimI-like enzyme